MHRVVEIAGTPVAQGGACYVIAEAGSNHDGDLAQAERLIDIAADCGCDAVKFQVFKADRLYPRAAGTSSYLGIDRPIFDIIAEAELPEEWLPQLAARAHDRGLAFLASAFDEQSADALEPHVDAFKIASYELTAHELVRYVAEFKKPVLLSTGAATLDEVAEAFDVVEATGNEDLVLFQCTAAYPSPAESLNLRAITTLHERFQVPVGLSDHSRDPVVAPLVAVSLGAATIEKHITISNDLPGPDHRFAVEPDELRAMVQRIRDAEAALGDGVKAVQPVEQELRRFARRTLFATRDIEAGEELTRENVAALRSGELEQGLEAKRIEEVLGRRAAHPIAVDSPIRAADCV